MSKDCGSFKDIEWGGHNTNRLLLFIFLFSFWWRGGASVPFRRADYALHMCKACPQQNFGHSGAPTKHHQPTSHR